MSPRSQPLGRPAFLAALACPMAVLLACQDVSPRGRGSNPPPSSAAPDAQAHDDAQAASSDASGFSADSSITDRGFEMDASLIADASSPSDAGLSDSGVLHGQRPTSALSVPAFMALNSDGSARSEVDLIGRPTVLWFFPFAGTSG